MATSILCDDKKKLYIPMEENVELRPSNQSELEDAITYSQPVGSLNYLTIYWAVLAYAMCSIYKWH